MKIAITSTLILLVCLVHNTLSSLLESRTSNSHDSDDSLQAYKVPARKTSRFYASSCKCFMTINKKTPSDNKLRLDISPIKSFAKQDFEESEDKRKLSDTQTPQSEVLTKLETSSFYPTTSFTTVSRSRKDSEYFPKTPERSFFESETSQVGIRQRKFSTFQKIAADEKVSSGRFCYCIKRVRNCQNLAALNANQNNASFNS